MFVEVKGRKRTEGRARRIRKNKDIKIEEENYHFGDSKREERKKNGVARKKTDLIAKMCRILNL